MAFKVTPSLTSLASFVCLTVVLGAPNGHGSSDGPEQRSELTVSHQLNFNPMRVLNASSAASLEQETTANATSLLSNTSLSDLQNDQGTIHMQQRYRARKKQERLFLIQAEILQRLRVTPSRHPNLTSPVFSQEERHRMAQIFDRMRNMRQHTHGNELNRTNQVFAERFQSFYPSCNPPNNTDHDLWDNSMNFRLFYNINIPSDNLQSMTNVLSGKLRIFKFHSPDPQQTNCVDCPNVPSSYPSFLIPTPSMTVSVYHFVKPLRSNRREKKRLIDSRFIAADLEGWIDFNILPSLQQWFHNRNKNYGLDIEVEDSSGEKLNPNHFFRRMNCTEGVVQEPPFPNLSDIHPDMSENESSLFDNETYPTLDLQTAEVQHPSAAHRPLPAASSGSNVVSNSEEGRMIRKRHAGLIFLRSTWYQVCRRERIFITFRDLGLEDVVEDSEAGLHVGYCAGKCVKDDHKTHNNNQMEERNCVATSFRPLHFKYMDEDGEMQDMTIHDVSAKDCTCAI